MAQRGLWARSAGSTADDVERARVEQRSIVRTWAMRGTLHLLSRDSLSPLYSAFGLRFIRTSKSRYRQLGLSEQIMERAVAAIAAMLTKRGAMTRQEIADGLAADRIPHEAQITFHLIRRAAFQGLACYGPERGSDSTFVLLEDWLGEPLQLAASEPSIASIARRYITSFGPAGPEDFAAWSGLPLTEARRGLDSIRNELLEVGFNGQPLLIPADCANWLDQPLVLDQQPMMLPAFDSLLLGYRDRALIVPQRHERKVHPGGGIIRPTVLIGGQAVGVWGARRSRIGLKVAIRLFTKLTGRQRDQVEKLAQDLGRFHDLQAEVVFSDYE